MQDILIIKHKGSSIEDSKVCGRCKERAFENAMGKVAA